VNSSSTVLRWATGCEGSASAMPTMANMEAANHARVPAARRFQTESDETHGTNVGYGSVADIKVAMELVRFVPIGEVPHFSHRLVGWHDPLPVSCALFR
jgi:hypothetical protein